MQSSYSRFLNGKEDIEVIQGSIGDAPGVVLLEFIAQHASLDTDAIIVETFVVDAHWVRLNRIDRAQVRQNLNLFLSCVRQTSRCQVILVVLPIRSLLLSEKKVWIEDLAEEMAALHNVDLLNLYAIARSLFAPGWKGVPAGAERRTKDLLQSVGLPTGDWAGYLWTTGLRVPWSGIGPLLRNAFQDELHVGEAIHALVADILELWLKSPREEQQPDTRLRPGIARPVISVPATGDGLSVVHRSSSILARDFTIIDSANPAVFKAARNQRAVGILVNRSKCFGVVTLSGDKGSVTYDMRLAPLGSWEFLAGVMPVPKDIGDGDFFISISGGDGPERAGLFYWDTTATGREISAEIGNIVLVDRDWEIRAHEDSLEPALVAKPDIQTLPWARTCVSDFGRVAELGAASVESATAFGLRPLLNNAIEAAGSDIVLDRARLFIALGDLKAATSVLSNLGDCDGSRRQQADDILKKIQDFQKDVQK